VRKTLDIADDVLFAAKEIAKREKKPSAPWSVNGRAYPFMRRQRFSGYKTPHPWPKGH
jgi:hypothetical protein